MRFRKNTKINLFIFGISIGLFISGSMIFFNTFSDNTFPQGEKKQGYRYTIQGEVHNNFPSRIDENGFNESLNFTYVPLTVGEGWEQFYMVQGDVRDEYERFDLVILETKWEQGTNESDQIWNISHYNPPHILFSISIFTIVVGLFVIVIPLIIAISKTKYNFKSMANYLWPLLLFFPGYHYGVVTYDLCLVLITGSILITLIPFSVLNILIMKKSEKKMRYSLFFALINGFISVLIGFSCGLFLSSMYINYFP